MGEVTKKDVLDAIHELTRDVGIFNQSFKKSGDSTKNTVKSLLLAGLFLCVLIIITFQSITYRKYFMKALNFLWKSVDKIV